MSMSIVEEEYEDIRSIIFKKREQFNVQIRKRKR